MLLFKRVRDISRFLKGKKEDSNAIGFIPTMGALHRGHLSLIDRSKQQNDLTVCSIYVNPTQFNDPKDLERYPRPIERDLAMLMDAGNEILFLPFTEEIYPHGIHDLKHYDLGHLEHFLEGASRPGHFQGVANVVSRLLEIVKPHRLYLGQKDFQQVKVLERVLKEASSSGKNGGIPQLIMCPIERESDGLAMSSRNVRLSPEQRKNAAGISRELFFIRDHWREFDLNSLKQGSIRRINSIPETQVDYLEFCDASSFTLIDNRNKSDSIVCVTAVNMGGVRLLDNVLIK